MHYFELMARPGKIGIKESDEAFDKLSEPEASKLDQATTRALEMLVPIDFYAYTDLPYLVRLLILDLIENP